MTEEVIRPREQAIENARLVLAEVPDAMQTDISPVAQLSVCLHTRRDAHGNTFTDEQIKQLRKTQHFLLEKLGKKYPNQPIGNIADALAVISQI